ncbi:MAG TPA: hypothetical protein VKN76_04580 [Kiloniellaceae bacterium]|nr:hypothetical protein [Kiloniellaceae bacterium]
MLWIRPSIFRMLYHRQRRALARDNAEPPRPQSAPRWRLAATGVLGALSSLLFAPAEAAPDPAGPDTKAHLQSPSVSVAQRLARIRAAAEAEGLSDADRRKYRARLAQWYNWPNAWSDWNNWSNWYNY